MLVAIVSDTHLPRRGRRLPAGCVERLRAAELIVHAGDLIALSVLEDLAGLGQLRAVRGNVDEPAVRAALPERLELELGAGGPRLGVIHDAGPGRGRLERLRRSFPGCAAVVFGHSHIPLHEAAPDGGFEIFNPGSPTDRRWAPHHTMGLLRAGEGRLGFELVERD